MHGDRRVTSTIPSETNDVHDRDIGDQAVRDATTKRIDYAVPLSTITPSLLSNESSSSFVVTPLAALAKLDIAVADKGGMPWMAGGGAISSVISSNCPLETGRRSGPVGIGIGVLFRTSGVPAGVSSGVNSGRYVGFTPLISEPSGDALLSLSSGPSSAPVLTLISCSVLVHQWPLLLPLPTGPAQAC